MADGTAGISSRSSSSRSDEANQSKAPDAPNACVDPTLERKRRDAEAAARAGRYYASASATAATTPVAADPKVSELSFEALTAEIVKQRAAFAASPNDAAKRSAIGSRLNALVDAWSAKASANGVAPPRAGFNPYTATSRELENAYLWTTVGGALPRDAAYDGGVAFRRSIVEAIALRSPRYGDQVIVSYAKDPGRQRVILERELYRLGEKTCNASDSNEQLIVRRASLLRQQYEVASAPDQRAKYIGLDGLTGSLQTTVDYEIEQRCLAMKTATTTGSVFAGVSAARGDSIEEIRGMGAAGDNAEGLAQALAGVDVSRTRSAKAEQTTSGRPSTTATGAPPRASTAGFSKTELAIVKDVQSISKEQLRAAFAAGGGEFKVNGRTIVVAPDAPVSGMTLFGEEGFVIGKDAFATDAELTKTLLHESQRLATSQSREAGVSQELATEETAAAASFADRAYERFFK